MARRRRRKQRPISAEALRGYAVPALRPRMGPGETLWRYTVTVPLEEILPQKHQNATAKVLHNPGDLVAAHFGGFTRLPASPGYGLRDPGEPEQQPEMNYNAYFAVLTSPLPAAEAYFRALREELETA